MDEVKAMPWRPLARWRTYLTHLLWSGLWLTTLLLLFFALARFLLYDRFEVMIWVNMATPYVYLPAYPVLLAAARRRRWGLTAVAGGIVALHIVWMIPHLPRPVPQPAATGPTLRLFNANLYAGNRDVGPILAEIEAVDPDVLLLQEYTPRIHQAFLHSGLLDEYPYGVNDAYPSPFGSAIWSKYPLRDAEVWDAAGIPMTRATLHREGRTVRLYNVHPPPPLFAIERWRRQQAAIVAAAAAEAGPVILAGDFNYTQHNRWFKELENGRFREIHLDRGRGWAVTWPNGGRLAPPIRLDHIFLTPEIVALSVREGEGHGSDHKPIIAVVAWK
jgi:endonuclease/exonuclease/phosphatase (EEP) superfamily protein YafD